MKLKTILTPAIIAFSLILPPTANAQFDFGGPFDWMDNEDDYSRYSRSGRGGRDYGRDRWRQYDEWEPNYWRYRYFDDDSDDYLFDDNDFFDGDFLDGDFLGDGRGRFNFDFDTDFRGDYEGDYDSDYRYRGDRYSPDYDRRSRRPDRSRRTDRRTDDRRSDLDRRSNDDRYLNERSRGDHYNDDYWREYSRQYDGNNRRRNDRRSARPPQPQRGGEAQRRQEYN